MPSIINASTSGAGGVITTADASGTLQLQTAGTTAISISTSQTAAFVAGTAGAPAITTAGDSNTGMFFPAADTIAFSEGGVESMRIGADGIATGTAGNLMLVSGTAQNSTSGTSIDFTGIPSWVKRITVMFSGVSTNGTSLALIQLGDSGGIENTGYLGRISDVTTAVNAFSSGFTLFSDNANTSIYHGQATLSLLNSASNLWVESSILGRSDNQNVYQGAGSKSLSATLDRIRITTVNGTDTFDAGSINILYEQDIT